MLFVLSSMFKKIMNGKMKVLILIFILDQEIKSYSLK